MSDANAPQATFWEELAPSWLEGERHSEQVAGRFGARAAERLAPQPGQRVLDIGCGSGPTTLRLATTVGPDGEAVGVDIAPSLVAAAQRRAADAGVTNARFLTADVQTEDLGEEPFDAAFSRFGVMFFSDPVAAFERIRRLLTPGGTLSFAAWQNLFANEWMFVPGSAVITVTGEFPPMPEPGDPGPFSLSDPGRIEEVLAAAGFTDIDVEDMAETVVLPAESVGSLIELTRNVGPVREALREADAETSDRILAEVGNALMTKVTDGELRLTAAAFIARAQA